MWPHPAPCEQRRRLLNPVSAEGGSIRNILKPPRYADPAPRNARGNLSQIGLDHLKGGDLPVERAPDQIDVCRKLNSAPKPSLQLRISSDRESPDNPVLPGVRTRDRIRAARDAHRGGLGRFWLEHPDPLATEDRSTVRGFVKANPAGISSPGRPSILS
jgi:hypothetical protein